jgi:hypothetical protein
MNIITEDEIEQITLNILNNDLVYETLLVQT